MTRRLKGLILTSLFLVLSFSCSELDKPTEGEDDETWIKPIEYPGGVQFYDAEQLADGSMAILCVKRSSVTDSEWLIVRVSDQGELISTLVPPTVSSTYFPDQLAPATDGNIFILYNRKVLSDGSRNALVYKIRSSGELIWKAEIEMLSGQFDLASCPSGGCFVYGQFKEVDSAGVQCPKHFVTRIDASGKVAEPLTIPKQQLGGFVNLYRAASSGDGTIIYFGSIRISSEWKPFIWCLSAQSTDTNSMIIDCATAGGPDVLETTENGVTAFYTASSTHTLISVNSTTLTSDIRQVRSPTFTRMRLRDAALLPGNEILGCGHCFNGVNRQDMIYYKIASDGSLKWHFLKGAEGYDEMLKICSAPDDGHIFIGVTNLNSGGKDAIIILKTDANGRY